MSSVEDIAKQCWQTGSKAVNKEDFDYATEMFHKAAVLVPDNLAYRQSLRSAEFRKYGNNGKGAGMMSKAKIMGLKRKLSSAKSKKDWDEVDKIAEEGLKLNPWDATFNAGVAEACDERGYTSVAIFAYDVAIGPQGEPENLKILRDYAYLLENDRKFKEASKIWGKVQKLEPNDSEARSKAMGLAFEDTIKEGGYDSAEGTRDVPVQSARPKGQAQEQRPGEDPEQDMKHAIRKDPKNVQQYQKLALFYADKGRYEEAHELYEQALDISGGDTTLREQMEDLEILKMKKASEHFKSEAQANPEDAEAKKRASLAARKLINREIEIFSEREKRYSQDKKLKFELAKRYQATGQWSKAIPLYQQVSLDPRMEVDALIALGKCFLKDDKGQLALKQFQKAVPKLSVEDKPEVFKDVHYILARLSEQAKDFKTAEDHYGEVLAVDYDYKDVRDRLAGLETK